MRRPVKTGLTYIRRAPYQAVAVIVVMAVTFFVTTLIALIMYGSTKLLVDFETRPQVIAFFNVDVSETQIASLKEKYESDSRVKDVKIVTKQEAFEFYKAGTPTDSLSGELVSPAILPPSLEMSLTDLSHADSVLDDLQKGDGVESVGFTATAGGEENVGSAVDRLRDVTKAIRIAGVVAVSVLLVTSLLVLLVVMSMRVSMRKSEIESLSLLGATSTFIRNPILVEASVYALVGVFFGWFGASLIVLYGSPRIFAIFNTVEVIPHDIKDLLIVLLAILGLNFVAGLIIALLGAMGAVSRSLRMLK